MTKVVPKRVTAQIWHETYRVRAGEYECVCSGMPSLGLAKASSTTDAIGHLESARGRMEGSRADPPTSTGL